MKRTITPEETKKLFEVCKNNAVEHYDIQIEIVDHLASLIEKQWEAEPDIEFDRALKKAVRKFGRYSFTKTRLQKEKELHRKYNRLLWQNFLEFYREPKMLMTLAGTMVLFTLFRIAENKLWIFIPSFLFLIISLLYYHFILFPKRFKIKTKLGKSFLILEQLKKVQSVAIVVAQLPVHIWNMSKFEFGKNPGILLIVSLLIVTFTLQNKLTF